MLVSVCTEARRKYTDTLVIVLVILAALAATSLTLVTNVNTGTGRLVVLGAVDKSLLDVGGEAVESLVDVDVALCRDFEERNTEFVGQRLALLC